MTSLKVVLAVAFATTILSTGCTFSMPEQGHGLIISTAANPGMRETVPQSSGASLAYDDHPARGR